MKNNFDEIQQDNVIEITSFLKDTTHKLESDQDLDPLMEKIGDARLVLLGEASHGTHEYYLWRAKISQRLIKEKGFDFIAVEGDWPDCYRINRFVKGYAGAGDDSEEVLRSFNRWPTWMWANWEIKAFADWLRDHNRDLTPEKQVGFYGLDVYSLWESILTIIQYLDKVDPAAADHARKAARCFEPYGYDDMTAYASSMKLVPDGCHKEVLELLQQIVKNIPRHDSDREAVFSAEQNAYVAVNAEEYYRSMMEMGNESWNIRDRHMVDMLERILSFYGSGSKGIVWEHNTHIGDARATNMYVSGMVNVGQLVRDKFAADGVVLVGFGSFKGSVVAAKNWGADMEVMPVPPARTNSWEEILHNVTPKNKLMILHNPSLEKVFQVPLGHRAIGVVYRPDQEYYNNYVPSMMARRYDAFIFFDETKALHPLHIGGDAGKIPETYPWTV